MIQLALLLAPLAIVDTAITPVTKVTTLQMVDTVYKSVLQWPQLLLPVQIRLTIHGRLNIHILHLSIQVPFWFSLSPLPLSLSLLRVPLHTSTLNWRRGRSHRTLASSPPATGPGTLPSARRLALPVITSSGSLDILQVTSTSPSPQAHRLARFHHLVPQLQAAIKGLSMSRREEVPLPSRLHPPLRRPQVRRRPGCPVSETYLTRDLPCPLFSGHRKDQ